MEKVLTIKETCFNELVINKSKFLTYCFKVSSEDEVKTILADLRKKYSDATHICYSYNLMKGVQKFSDDGEPQGTAGKPMLDCILKKNLKDILVCTVRYFGGIKLGAGGLLRAYSNSVSLALDNAQIKELNSCVKLVFNIGIKDAQKFENLKKLEYVLSENLTYGEDVKVDVIILKENENEFIGLVNNLLSGNLKTENRVELYY